MKNNKFNENNIDEEYVFKENTAFAEKDEKEILSKKMLSINDEYAPTSASPMEIVEKSPRKFIIEECIPACKELWSKNIYTFMVSDALNILYGGECWIEINLDNLSTENKEILTQLNGNDVIKFPYHAGCLYFGVKYNNGVQAQARLLELAQQFQMQDVPYKDAYITLPEYLILCGCYDEVKNPNYVEMPRPLEMDSSEITLDVLKYAEWEKHSEKTHKVFNKSKMTKPLEEYLNDTGAIYDGDRVYLSDYHYKKHLNYVNSLTQANDVKHKI